MTPLCSLLLMLAYILAGRLIIRHGRGTPRAMMFAGLNLAFFFVFFFPLVRWPIFLAYVGLVVCQYLMLRLFANRTGWQPWLAFFTPIFFLIVIRYVPNTFYAHFSGAIRQAINGHSTHYSIGYYFIGISYLAFRSSQLVLEVRNGVVPRPGLWEYLGFCFFVPTAPVGPINPYRNHQSAFAGSPLEIPEGRAALRCVVGAVKYFFLAVVLQQLTYAGLLDDSHYHPWPDVLIAILFYYLYLYLNFSGFCDMAIGAAGLMGIPVAENFNNPFAARNVKDFWNRWHITLSAWMRDVVFSPLSKYLVRRFGIKQADHAIALTIVIIFLLVGAWHGVGWNFVAFGAAHALGVVTNHYYTLFLKKRLGRDGFKAYNENRWIHAAAVVLTFCYCSASLIFFANTFPQIKEFFASLQ